jgi:hypothetical protein
MEPGTVVSFCDRTGAMVRPWREAGYRAITVDLQSATTEFLPGLRHHVIADIRAVGAEAIRRKAITPIVAVFAFPPCTNLAVSGARWFKSKGLGGLIEGLEIGQRLPRAVRSPGCPMDVGEPREHAGDVLAQAGSHFSSVAVHRARAGRQLHQEDLPLDGRRLRHARAERSCWPWRARQPHSLREPW